MSMLRTFASRGERRPCYLYFGVKELGDITFRDEIDRLSTTLPLRVDYLLSRPPADWTGRRGYIDIDLLRQTLPANSHEFQYFICGPGAMQDAMEDGLGAFGVPASNVHTERFNFV